jgi:integrase
MPRKQHVPSLRRHKPSGLGVVTLNGKDHYLGRWPAGRREPPPEVRQAYDRLLSDWLENGRRLAAPAEAPPAPAGGAGGLTVAEVIARFWSFAEGYYRYPDGRPTNELNDYRYSLRPLNHLFGALPARKFGPRKLKAVRRLMVQGYEHPKYGTQAALSRGVVNQRVARIVRTFRWATEEQLVAARVWQALSAVRRLQKGRSDAYETEPVRPAPAADVEAVLPLVLPPVAAMIQLQLLTGMRPGEACLMRACDIDRAGPVWVYRPPHHKTSHHNKDRFIAIGPKGQELLKPWLRVRCPLCGAVDRPHRIAWQGGLCGPCTDRTEEAGVCGPWPAAEAPGDYYLFSPREAMADRRKERRAARRSRVQPSQAYRRKKKPKRAPGERYRPTAYLHAIRRGCERAGVPAWHPHQLRHAHASAVRHRFGLEAAQVTLGHSHASVTQVYTQRNLRLAVEVAQAIG